MNREQQYNTLVEIVANVRLLLAHGDTNDYAEKNQSRYRKFSSFSWIL